MRSVEQKIADRVFMGVVKRPYWFDEYEQWVGYKNTYAQIRIILFLAICYLYAFFLYEFVFHSWHYSLWLPLGIPSLYLLLAFCIGLLRQRMIWSWIKKSQNDISELLERPVTVQEVKFFYRNYSDRAIH